MLTNYLSMIKIQFAIGGRLMRDVIKLKTV